MRLLTCFSISLYDNPAAAKSALAPPLSNNWYVSMYLRPLAENFLWCPTFTNNSLNAELPFLSAYGCRRYFFFDRPQLYSIPSPASSQWYFGIATRLTVNSCPNERSSNSFSAIVHYNRPIQHNKPVTTTSVDISNSHPFYLTYWFDKSVFSPLRGIC